MNLRQMEISPEVHTISWLSVFFDIPSERKAVSKYKLSEFEDFSRKTPANSRFFLQVEAKRITVLVMDFKRV